MIGYLFATAIALLIIGYLLGKQHGSSMVFNMWKESKKSNCIHNVMGVVGYPKGDRTVCFDCGDTEPVLKKLEDHK